ncbi:MAG: hypothetical protein ACLR8Y_08775 [Alistipes indistinctus]
MLASCHRDHYGRLTAARWLLRVLADPDRWSREPFIYLPDKSVTRAACRGTSPRTDEGSPGPRDLPPGPDIAARRRQYAALHDFFDPQDGYRLAGAVEKAYAKAPGARDKRDAETSLKADEEGQYPVRPAGAGVCWLMFPAEFALVLAGGRPAGGLAREDSLLIAKILPAYSAARSPAAPSPAGVAGLLSSRNNLQHRRAGPACCPPHARISAEIFYNRADIFRTVPSLPAPRFPVCWSSRQTATPDAKKRSCKPRVSADAGFRACLPC